jgi:cobalt-zinc-cadmium efflux system protein
VAIIGLAVNLTGMYLLKEGSNHNLNMKGAYLEVLSDILGSVGVIIASIIIMTTGWTLADPIISAGIGLFILPRTWILLRQVIHILMEGTPGNLNLKEIAESIQKIQNVQSVHDLHVWTITSGFDALSVHVTVDEGSSHDRVLKDLETLLKDQFGIAHPTIQVETKICDPAERCL